MCIRDRFIGRAFARELGWETEPLLPARKDHSRSIIGENVGKDKKPMPQKFSSKIDARGKICLLYTSDAADERSSVDLGGRRIINKKNK